MTRCKTCDRPPATAEQWDSVGEGERPDLCWGEPACSALAVDWRERAEAERTRREAAEEERDALRDEGAEALAARVHDEGTRSVMAALGDSITALRERAEKAEAERDEYRTSRSRAALTARLATAERELAEALELVAVLRRSAETSEVFDDLASRTSGLLAKTHEAELTSALASRDAALAALAEVTGAGEAWPLADVLARLVEGAEHLLAGHDCDHHGYETLDGAKREAARYVTAARLAASPAALGAKVIADAEERVAEAAVAFLDEHNTDDMEAEDVIRAICKAARGAR